jgi:serine/threonine protein kinase
MGFSETMIRLLTDPNALLGQSLGTCTIQRLVGRGGMSAVYVAQQTRPRREVAVKVLLPALLADQPSRTDFLARFRREADAIATLDHINIIPIYEYGEQEHVAYLMMPYVLGGSLHQVLEKRGVLQLSEALPILEQAAAALDYAHAKGIIHRDLKPGNILFHSDGRVLLADFGLAKVLGDEDNQQEVSALTRTGTVIGTPEYLSPEQAAGRTLDQRSDIYSLGVVLFHMLTGRVPFSGATPVATAMLHVLSVPPSLSQLNPTLSPVIEAVVMKALAKQPEQRYESAGQFAQALSAAAGFASERVPEAVHTQARTNLAPLMLMNQETLPESLISPANRADTVVDIIKGADRQQFPARVRQWSPTSARYPAAPKQRASWQAAIFGVILILLLVISGSLAYLYVALRGHSTANISRTPVPLSTTISTATPTMQVDLPAPAIPAGKLLYGTSMPSCNPAGESWSIIANARVTCGPSATELANTRQQHLAGMALNILPNGQPLPDNYILQVQVREGPPSHGAFGILFRNQAGSSNLGAYSFWLSPDNSWSARVYEAVTKKETQLYQHKTTVQLHGVVTITIRVQGDNFNLYIQGHQQGYAISSLYHGGTVGLVVDKGADTFFSNFALYALPNHS